MTKRKSVSEEDLKKVGEALSELTRTITKLASNALDEVKKK